MIKTLEDAKKEGVLVNNIYNADCLEVMKQMPDQCIDLVITDPPYSRNTITAHSRKGTRNLGDLSIQEFFYRSMYELLSRIVKEGGSILTFCDDLFYPILFASSYNCLQGHSLLIWDKKHISFGRPIRKRHELIMYTSSGPGGQFYPSKKRLHMPSIIEHSKQRDREHDAQKPISLLQDLLEHFSKETDLIFDPFLGSGTTAVAYKNLHRNFIGIEISEKYCEIAQKRLGQQILL